MNEQELITKILKGDTASFGFFVDTYQDMAMTIAFRICRNKQDAEDIVQNAFVRAYNSLNSYRSKSKFSTWFYRIVYNTAISQITKFQSKVEQDTLGKVENELSSLESIPSLPIEQQEQSDIITLAIDQLPKDEAVILTLYYLEEHSIKEVAKIMSLTESNIKVKLHRARQKMQESLKSYDYGR